MTLHMQSSKPAINNATEFPHSSLFPHLHLLGNYSVTPALLLQKPFPFHTSTPNCFYSPIFAIQENFNQVA